MKKKWVAGIDNGGTNVRVALGNNVDGFREDSYVSRPVDFSKGNAGFTENLMDMIEEAAMKVSINPLDISFYGIASAGQPTHDHCIERAGNCPFTLSFPRDLGADYRIVNDVAGGAYGAMKFGYGSTMFKNQATPRWDAAMTIGTGTSIQMLMEGELISNACGQSGESGHITSGASRKDGRLCGCGARGCDEAYFTGSGIRMGAVLRLTELYHQKYKRDDEAMSRDKNPIIALATEDLDSYPPIPTGIIINTLVKPKHVFEAAKNGYELAKEIIEEGEEYLARHMGNMMNALPPIPYIEVYGSIPEKNPEYLQAALEKLKTPGYSGNRDPDAIKWLLTEAEDLAMKGTVAMALHYVK